MANNNQKSELTKKYMDEIMRLYRERTPEPTQTAEEKINIEANKNALPEESLCKSGGDCGILQVEVTTANGDFPIEGAHITVYDESGENVLRFMLSDINGISPESALSAPPRSISQSPEESKEKKPYSVYRIRVTAEGFYPVVNERVAIFSGIKSIQPVNMIPIAEFSDNPDKEMIFKGAEPSDLEGKGEKYER